MDEFARIARLLAPLAGPEGLGLKDDAALFSPPPGRQLVLTADAMVAGVHFFPDDPPALIAKKLLRVNLSDLAAMGARPEGYLLTTSLPRGLGEEWLASFCAGLAEDQARYGIRLWGGDSTATEGPVTLSLTAIGSVAEGRALRRSGAKPGDVLMVTGTLGDAALGLVLRRRGAREPEALLNAYLLPDPPLMLAEAIGRYASAGMDVSDGLLQDAGHIADASGVALIVERDRLPLSDAARSIVEAEPVLWERVLTGGDDYQLLLAVPPPQGAALAEEAARHGMRLTAIGRIEAGSGVICCDAAGAPAKVKTTGYQHFSG